MNGLKALITGLALVAATALPALAQDVSAPDNSARINAIKKSGVLRVAVLANAPWLVESTTGGGETRVGNERRKPPEPLEGQGAAAPAVRER